jgi:hypothetical protein
VPNVQQLAHGEIHVVGVKLIVPAMIISVWKIPATPLKTFTNQSTANAPAAFRKQVWTAAFVHGMTQLLVHPILLLGTVVIFCHYNINLLLSVHAPVVQIVSTPPTHRLPPAYVLP